MAELSDILAQFDPISLSDMNMVTLMDRIDTKYLFDRSNLSEILDQVKSDYLILEENHKRLFDYRTLYYDTPDFRFYMAHHNGRLNRFKIRHRTYEDSDTGYFEIKFKTNKGRTVKERIAERSPDLEKSLDAKKFIESNTPIKPDDLHPSVEVVYKRISLVNKNRSERISMDVDLEFIHNEQIVPLHHLVIAEVKQDKKTLSPFNVLMRKLHIREGSISKYCTGVAMTNNSVKKNNFKPNLILLKKFTHDN